MTPLPDALRDPGLAARVAVIAESFKRLLGRPLVSPDGDLVAAIWAAPFAVVAHGTEPDPIFFFGNDAALRAFECEWEPFTAMPSRLSAEAPLRDERQALLDRVTRDGFIDDYAGVRISAKGRRFGIADAVVWNLIDGRGQRRGQAAMFAV